jgi:hypothetical protein
MASFRANQNLALNLDVPHRCVVTHRRFIMLGWLEHYCLRNAMDCRVLKNIIFNFYTVEWSALCRKYSRIDMLIFLRQVDKHYARLSKQHKISMINIDNNFTRSQLFERSTQWETIFFNINKFHKSFGSSQNIKNNTYNQLAWSRFYKWDNSLTTIHFVRVQRRYNKRRYSRARVVSRPSFWSGSLMSAMGLGMFWGSTLQMTDWVTTQLILVDITNLLLIFYFYIFWRICTLVGRGSLYSVRGNFHINQGFRTIIQKNFNNARWWK